MRVLVTGAAGYIGSHAVQELRRKGHAVVGLDNLCRGHREAIPEEVPLVVADIRDTAAVRAALTEHRIDAVMHFAAFAYVGESVTLPLLYYDNNVRGSVSLLEAMSQAGVSRLVFSSTCATYGEPERMPITEGTPQRPINPYGRTKLVVEGALADFARATPGFSYAALRYFNVAGSARDGSLGEDHDPEPHIIPSLLLTAAGRREKVQIFGDDYPTPDGTCVRDYIHVEDLVRAHARVLEILEPGRTFLYNLGTGRGHSVRELVRATEAVTGKTLRVEVAPRRPGDPPELCADPGKIRAEVGWQAEIADVETMVETAWRWFRDHPDGYRSAR